MSIYVFYIEQIMKMPHKFSNNIAWENTWNIHIYRRDPEIGTFGVYSPLSIKTSSVIWKCWCKISLNLWRSIPDLPLNVLVSDCFVNSLYNWRRRSHSCLETEMILMRNIVVQALLLKYDKNDKKKKNQLVVTLSLMTRLHNCIW